MHVPSIYLQKLHQIEQLKEKQLKGEKLEANQVNAMLNYLLAMGTPGLLELGYCKKKKRRKCTCTVSVYLIYLST